MTAEAVPVVDEPAPQRASRRSAVLGHLRTAGAVVLALAPWTWYAVRDLRPVLEWAAIALPVAAGAAVVLAALLALVAWSARLLAVVLAWALFWVTAVVGPWVPADAGSPGEGLRLVAANVGGGAPVPLELAGRLIDLDADVLVVSELPSLRGLVERLDAAYPHVIRPEGGSDVVVWSRQPLAGEALADDALRAARGARVVVRAPRGPFALYALHLLPPSPDPSDSRVTVAEQRVLVERLVATLEDDPLPVVVAGDLNLPDRGPSFRRLAAGRVDAARDAWTGPTSTRTRNRPLLLRIDHVLLPAGWCSDEAGRAELPGSDHRAVLATIGPCRRRGSDNLSREGSGRLDG